MVFAVIWTGVVRFCCCQPEPLSLVNVASASCWPDAFQRWPMCVPVLFDCL